MDYYDILIDEISDEVYVLRIIHTRSWIAAELPIRHCAAR